MSVRRVAFAILGLTCAGLLIYGLVLRGSGQAPSGQPGEDGGPDSHLALSGAQGWVFDVGRKTVYQLRYEDRITFHLDRRGPAEQRVNLSAALHLRVLANRGHEVVCAFQLSNLRLELPDHGMARLLAPLYGEVFLVTMGSDGAFKEVHLPLHPEDQDGLRRLVGLLQIIWADASHYTRHEAAARGVYTAEYRRRGARLEKRRTGLVEQGSSGHTTEIATTEIVASRFAAQADPRGNWLSQLEAREHVRVLHSGKVTVENRTRLTVVKQRTPPDPNLTIWSDVRPADAVLGGIEDRARTRRSVFRLLETRAAQDRVASKNLSMDGVLARLQLPGSAHEMRVLQDLEALLVAGAQDEVTEGALVAACTAASAAQVVSVLEQVGNQLAQRVLRRVSQASGYHLQSRVRAIIALGGLEHPDGDTISLLRRFVDGREASADASLRDTAVLALGALAGKADAELHEELKGYLINKLSHPPAPGMRKAVLLAMQNAGIDGFIAQVLPFLRSGDRLLRMTAASVLEGTRSQAAHVALRAALKAEAQPKIRQRIERSLAAPPRAPSP